MNGLEYTYSLYRKVLQPETEDSNKYVLKKIESAREVVVKVNGFEGFDKLTPYEVSLFEAKMHTLRDGMKRNTESFIVSENLNGGCDDFLLVLELRWDTEHATQSLYIGKTKGELEHNIKTIVACVNKDVLGINNNE